MGNLRDAVEVFRRIRALITYARVLRVDDSGELQLLQIEGYLSETREGVERIGEFGFASNPPTDSQAVVLARGGSRGKLLVIGIEDRRFRPKNLPSGSSEIYAQNGTRVRVNADGSIEIDGATVTINTTGDTEVNATGEARITAAVVRLGGVSEIDGIGFAAHTHISSAPGVVSGPAQGVPIP